MRRGGSDKGRLWKGDRGCGREGRGGVRLGKEGRGLGLGLVGV